MSEPYLGEIQQWGFNFAPLNTAFCNGQMQQISQHAALYALIGIQFGGDAVNTFQLPDLRGRAPVHPGFDINKQGLRGGAERVTLLTNETGHSHQLLGAEEDGDGFYGVGYLFANVGENPVTGARLPTYGPAVNLTTIANGAITSVGGNQDHTNIQPCIAINFTIALEGTFPQRN